MVDDGMIIDGVSTNDETCFFLKPGAFSLSFNFLGLEKWLFCGYMKTEVGFLPEDSSKPRGPQLSCGRSHCTLRLGCTKTPGHHAPWRGNQKDGGLDFWGFGGRDVFG